jgi:Transposase DDE domain group 1
MIWLLRPDQPKPTEFAPAMEEGTRILPGLPAVAGKPVHVGFDGGRLTSDGGILLLAAVEQRLKIAERLAACLEDPRDPDRVVHQFAEMIRYRALLIAAGYPDGNDCDALKSDPAFQNGDRTAAGKRRGSVLATDHQPAGEPARRDRA